MSDEYLSMIANAVKAKSPSFPLFQRGRRYLQSLVLYRLNSLSLKKERLGEESSLETPKLRRCYKRQTLQQKPVPTGGSPTLIRTFCFANVAQGERGGFKTCLLALLIIQTPNLQAHNVVAGAYVDGMVIEGEIGFSNGDSALPDVLIEVLDEAGNKVGETRIEDDGLFTFTASDAQKHILKANIGAGHVAEIIVEADEFTSTKTSEKASPTPQTASQNAKSVTGISATELESIVRKAVAQQVKPLQKELRAYKEKVMLRDITGGLGFIFGLFGVAAWMASRKRKPEQG